MLNVTDSCAALWIVTAAGDAADAPGFRVREVWRLNQSELTRLEWIR